MIINWGDAPFKAFIKVTYNAGTCTCKMGSETFTHSGGGTVTFEVKKKGIWTVTVTGRLESKSSNVDVSKSGETYSVTINVKTRIYFYNRGNLGESGGWGSNAPARTEFNADYIYIRGTGSGPTFIHSQVPVPLACTKMYIVGEVLDEVNDICFEQSGLANNSDWSLTVAWSNGTVGTFTRVVDISGVTTLSGRYVKICVGWGVNCKGNIYEVYFE